MNRITSSVALAVTALLCTAAPALADDDFTTESVAPSWTAASSDSCADPDTAPLLSSFGDHDLYAPAPGGAFEDGADGWQFDGGASVAAADGGLGALGPSQNALDLPVGGSAVSPTFCVDERYPRFRFSYADESPDQDADVRVEVIYPGLEKDNVRKAKDLKAQHGKGWRLSDRINLDPTHGLKRRGWRLVAIRIEVRDGEPGAHVRVDDVVIDPKARA